MERDYQRWLESHMTKRKGARWERICNGLGFSEELFLKQIWWPSFHSFEFLHPEYEVVDGFTTRRYLDFAYIRNGVKIGFELDGYSVHATPPTRQHFNDQWVRHMQLMNVGWHIVRIATDDLKERPLLWQNLIQLYIGKHFTTTPASFKNSLEHGLVEHIYKLNRAITLADIEVFLGCKYRVARRILDQLISEDWLIPTNPRLKRSRSWQLTNKFRYFGMPTNASAELIPNKKRNRYLGNLYFE